MTDPIVSLPGVTVERAPAERQWLLHADPDDAEALAAAAQLALPNTLLTGATSDGWTALHLSPDEWLLVAADDADDRGLAARFGASGIAHSLVDVSDRSSAIVATGALAADALAGGCPLDLERFPDGHCTRTLFGKITVLLRRTGDRWRLDYGGSFDGYVVELIGVVARDAVEASA